MRIIVLPEDAPKFSGAGLKPQPDGIVYPRHHLILNGRYPNAFPLRRAKKGGVHRFSGARGRDFRQAMCSAAEKAQARPGSKSGKEQQQHAPGQQPQALFANPAQAQQSHGS